MSADIKTFDLREEYRRNAEPWEPFSKMVFATDQMAPGGALVLIAPFEPTILLRLLSCMGFEQRTIHGKPGLWEIVVRKTSDKVCNERGEIDLDLRGLPALPPLEKICHAFALLPWKATMRIRTDTRPQHCPSDLLPEGVSKRVEQQPDGTFLSTIRPADKP
ncbi:MAG: DUF2249 domain-containing protein [Verrucomicrobia bacterium]|nr:DUF2249 domain-containing protein [Verrucomicrobiota bacterium]